METVDNPENAYDELLRLFRAGASVDDAMLLLLERFSRKDAIAVVTAISDQEKARLAAGGEVITRDA